MLMLESVLSRTTGSQWTRETLDARRQAIAGAHTHGATGVEVVTALTGLADEVLLDLYHASLGIAGISDPSGVALVALGGYGRRELAPYSDIDLMFLYAPHTSSRPGPCPRRSCTPSGISGFRSVTACGPSRIAGRWVGRISPYARL